MALMHSGHAYACIATLSDALRRRQQGVENRDARFGLVFYIKNATEGLQSLAQRYIGRLCCYPFFLYISPLFFLSSPYHIFPSHCSIRDQGLWNLKKEGPINQMCSLRVFVAIRIAAKQASLECPYTKEWRCVLHLPWNRYPYCFVRIEKGFVSK